MTISIASPDPVSSAPARFFGLLRSTIAAVGSPVGRVLRNVTERVEILVRGGRGVASDVDVVPAVRAQPTAVVDGPETGTGLVTPGTAASLRTARILSVVVAVATVLASAVGLWRRGLYQDPASAAAMFRGYSSLRSAVTGAALPQGVLVQPAPILRLGYVMDLATLVPGYAGSAWLLWHRRPWGYVLAAVLLTASGVIQLDYMTALLFQAAAKVPGTTPYDPQEPFIAAAIVVAAAVLLANLRRVRQDDAATPLRVLS